MRKRLVTDHKSWPVFYYHQDHPLGAADFSWNSFTYHKYMEDVSSSQDHKFYDWVNPCFHEKWQYIGENYKSWTGDYGLPITLHSVGPNAVPPFFDTVALLGMIPSFSEGDRNLLILDAFNAFNEVWPEELSAGETAQGLLELKSMIPKFTGDFVRDLAALHLNKSFAWDSLLSDIDSLGALTKSVEKRLAWLRKTYGKPTPLHFKRIVPMTEGLGGSLDFVPVRGWGTRCILRQSRLEFYAGATLHQLMGHLDDMIGYVRGIVGALGGANPAKQVWNLIPLSFVVDYFFNISARLDALTRLKPVETWELTRVTHSFKTSAIWDVWQTHPDLYSHTCADQYLGKLHYAQYHRGIGLPFDVLNFDIKTLSPSQLGLLAALGAAI
jgi:hypothetical protein